MRILVCGWIGSTNLGDELVFAGVRRALKQAYGGDVRVAAISVDPAATRRVHHVAAIDHRRLDLVNAAARRADLVVFGGGGLVQDETSPFNLPYHLSRTWLARLGRTPVVGLGLGVGPLDTRLGRGLARTLSWFDALTVRDEASRRLAERIGVDASLGADTAWHLAERTSATAGGEAGVEGEVIAVALRPWGARSRLPVHWRTAPGEPEWFVDTTAAALDRVAKDTGARLRLVAMQTDRDGQLHERVIEAMTTPAELATPTLDTLLEAFTGVRLTIAMRYHAGIASTIAGAPSVLIGYSPKVDALAATLGAGATRLAFDAPEVAGLDRAAARLIAGPQARAAVSAAAEVFLTRREANRAVLAAVG